MGMTETSRVDPPWYAEVKADDRWYEVEVVAAHSEPSGVMNTVRFKLGHERKVPTSAIRIPEGNRNKVYRVRSVHDGSVTYHKAAPKLTPGAVISKWGRDPETGMEAFVPLDPGEAVTILKDHLCRRIRAARRVANETDGYEKLDEAYDNMAACAVRDELQVVLDHLIAVRP